MDTSVEKEKGGGETCYFHPFLPDYYGLKIRGKKGRKIFARVNFLRIKRYIVVAKGQVYTWVNERD